MQTTIPLCLWFLCVGCAMSSTPREERHKMEMSLHNIRTEMEGFKHDLNSSEIELHVLEGKLMDQAETLGAVKKQLIESLQNKLNGLEERCTAIEKLLKQAQKQQEEFQVSIKKLTEHASDTLTALSQYRDKMFELERYFNGQNQKIQELIKLKAALEKLTQELTESETPVSYQGEEGDSVEKIAKDVHIFVGQLEKLNEGDLIVVEKNT